MKRAIIFDLDGTLVDSCGICIHILDAMLAERGRARSIEPEYARSYMSYGGQKMITALLGDACHDPAADLAEFRARYGAVSTPRDSLFEGVAEGLKELAARGFLLAICSNKPQTLCEKVLRDTHIADFFTAIVGGMEGLAPKPAPDLLDRTLQRLELTANECIYVGDSRLDYEVAERAGMPFYFLTHGYAEPDWSPPADTAYGDFAQLAGELARHRPADLAA